MASKEPIEFVLGGGGVKGLGHCGFLKGARELRVKRGRLTGVSIGSWIAAFASNGFEPEEIEEIFVKEIVSVSPGKILRAMVVPSWLGFLSDDAAAGFVSIKHIADDLVRRYNLRPNPDLRIIAYNLLGREPVVFEGEDYDLSVALSASSAVPLVMRPVWYGQKDFVSRWLTLIGSAFKITEKGILVDGGVHHPAPGDFSQQRAIIAKLGFTSQLPSRLLGPVDMWFHMLELVGSRLLSWYFPDPANHVVVPVGSPDVACLSFGIPEDDMRRMVSFGYDETIKHVKPAIKAGLVPTSRARRSQ